MCRCLARYLVVAGALLLLSLTLSPPVRADDAKTVALLGGAPDTVTLTAEEQQFVALVNAERTARGIPALTVVPLLVATAREKSQEMHDLDYWGHVSPNEKKRTAIRRVMAALPEMPKALTVGENLYYCSTALVKEGHEALMNSPTHRKNILNPKYTYLGIGGYTAPDGRFWLTQHFLAIEY